MRTGVTGFRSLFGDGRRVEIPVIQRDFAQGRNDERSAEIRVRFVADLARALMDDEVLDLDFVYGRLRQDERTLEPLDGQQRLTTLFLLHWYLACLDGKFHEYLSWMMHEDGESCFTYRTRPAAREFFDALIEHPAPIDTLASCTPAISEWLSDSVWFVRGWRRDPTVRGCLTMLDAIQRAFVGSSGAWERLVSAESPISFKLLLLKNFNLSDDLYIKMNARGKALTLLEVFKAQLEQFVASSFGDELHTIDSAITWRHHVSHQFDNAWTDFLWRFLQTNHGQPSDLDSWFIHLIRALVLVACVNQDAEAGLLTRIEQLLANPAPSLAALAELGGLDQHTVRTVVGVLDTLATNDTAVTFLGQVGYVDEAALFRRILLARGANQEDGLTLVDWVLFYAWCAFLLRFAPRMGDATVQAACHDWMRVAANLARNSDIDRPERLGAAVKGLRQLSSSAGVDFLAQLAAGALDKAGGFNQQQQREERMKAGLLLRSDDWRSLIERAERHPYFAGGIEFLLRFSGVFARFDGSSKCDWSDDEDANLRGSFADWYERTCAVFPEDATSWPAPFPDFLLERALLAEGDYMLPRGRNWSFLDDKDRDASWKRLLRADTRVADREERRDVVRRVLARLDPKDGRASLQLIVEAGVQGADLTPLPDFRTRLVVEPRLIRYCGQRLLRLEEGTAFLLGSAQRNHYHVDLYVYDLHFRLQARLAELSPFDAVRCTERRGTDLPCEVVLCANDRGLEVTVTRHGADMRLQLRIQQTQTDLATVLCSWTTEGENVFIRFTSPDAIETTVVELATVLRTILLLPKPDPAVASGAYPSVVAS